MRGFKKISLCYDEEKGGPQPVKLEQCALQIDQRQDAAERRAPEEQQIDYLHKQC